MGQGIHVLYVTGDSPVLDSAGGTLERESDRLLVTPQRRGTDALDRLDGRFDCVLSHYRLPEMDGLDLLDSVRDDFPELPFVLVTDEGDERVASAAISAGVSEYVRPRRHERPAATLAGRIEDTVAQYREYRSAKESQRRLAELTDSTTDCLWIFSADWEELLYISGYEEVWGRPTEHIEDDPQHFLDGIHPAYRAHVREAMERLSGGESIDVEYRISHPDDGQRWVWAKGEPVFDDGGTVTRIVGFTRDITERRERERRYRTLVENLPGVVYRSRVDPAWPMEFVHGQCEQLTGYTPTELTGEVDFGTDIVHPEDRDEVYETVRAALDEDRAFELTYRIQHKDGECRWVSEWGREVDDGVIEGFITDVTDRISHKRDLELRNRAISEAPIGITITDPDQEDNPILYANERFCEMTGYDTGEIEGRNCRFLQGPETAEEPVAAMREAIDAEEPVTVELRNYRKNGSVFWNRVSVAPVFDDDGSLTSYIGFQEDVSERKQRQNQLQVLSRVLRHNIRNEKNVVQSWAEAIRTEADDDLAAYAQHIIDKSDELLSLAETERRITEILTERPRPHCIDVPRMIRRAVRAVQQDNPGAAISTTVPDGTTLSAVPQLESAVEELVRNAVCHSDDASPSVCITVTDSGGSVSITVADDGPPIPEMEQNVLLDRHGESQVYHGGGLGLWFVNIVVTQSEGHVTVEDNDPRGNVVTVTLPSS